MTIFRNEKRELTSPSLQSNYKCKPSVEVLHEKSCSDVERHRLAHEFRSPRDMLVRTTTSNNFSTSATNSPFLVAAKSCGVHFKAGSRSAKHEVFLDPSSVILGIILEGFQHWPRCIISSSRRALPKLSIDMMFNH